ncbi:STAS domain-containing protein [Planobispora takensis]|uniref:STAS domain-containing protein n=1 Tax=Planobispora takensis TaxID=1367882 RepID=A0A8J3T0H8_9ACTN|nr:STAS domain-containing protein [Planobispora takensis]GII03111.1 hypothetical protein Pta02_51190 [Planobispora takensis]
MPAAPADPPPSPAEIITIHTADETITVRVHGVLGHISAPMLECCLAALQTAESTSMRNLVLNISALTGCDSAGLHTVLTAIERAERRGIALRIDGLDGVAGRVLASSHLRTGGAIPDRTGRRQRSTPRAPGVLGRHRSAPR